MEELWSNDRATGSWVRTARDINSPPDISNFSVNLDDNNMDYIPEQPNFEEADDYVPRSLLTLHQTLLLCLLILPVDLSARVLPRQRCSSRSALHHVNLCSSRPNSSREPEENKVAPLRPIALRRSSQ